MTKTRAGIYVRISNDREQLRMGVERQLQDTRRICEDEGWIVVGPYEDNDKTAADPNKPRLEYDRMMRDIRAGKIDVVVVAVSDRLHRQPAELEQFIADATTAGMTRLRTDRRREYDLADYEDVRDMRKEVIDAAYEVARLRSRVRRGMKGLAASGKFNGGGRPYGYRVVTKEQAKITGGEAGLYVDESEAFYVRDATERVLAGETLYSIQQDWKKNEVPSARGNPVWSITSLRKMLVSPCIVAKRQYLGEIIGDAQWPALVDYEDWQRVVAILTDPSRKQVKASRKYPLRGVLRCANCEGHPLLEVVCAKKQRGYGCPKLRGGCGLHINADRVEEHVYRLVLPMADNPAVSDAIRSAEASNADEMAAIIASNSADTTKLAEIADMFMNGELDRATYAKMKTTLEERIDGRQTQLAGMRGQSALDRLGGQVVENWDEMSPDDKRMVLFAMIESVHIAKATRKGAAFDTGRVRIMWRYDAIKKVALADGVARTGGGSIIIRPDWKVRTNPDGTVSVV
jgi:DNA invertase Pin-like site-specific DNA recombinase